MTVGTKLARPEWATTIEHAREALGLSQAGLARRLSVSPMAVSRWERGINEPSASIYITLGKSADSIDRWLLWGRVGLTREDLESALRDGSPAAANPNSSAAAGRS